jgi:hypothetical protein
VEVGNGSKAPVAPTLFSRQPPTAAQYFANHPPSQLLLLTILESPDAHSTHYQQTETFDEWERSCDDTTPWLRYTGRPPRSAQLKNGHYCSKHMNGSVRRSANSKPTLQIAMADPDGCRCRCLKANKVKRSRSSRTAASSCATLEVGFATDQLGYVLTSLRHCSAPRCACAGSVRVPSAGHTSCPWLLPAGSLPRTACGTSCDRTRGYYSWRS